MNDDGRFICGFCKQRVYDESSRALEETTFESAAAGDVAMFACGNCGAILGFVSIAKPVNPVHG